jgi:hypothetical protein
VAKKTHTNIAVVESRWFEDVNTSVRSVFEMIADIHCHNPNSFHYEMANSKDAMKDSIHRLSKIENIQYLSIASHGGQDEIHTFNEDILSRTVLRNSLKKGNKSRTLYGLHFGACSTLTPDLAKFLFDGGISPWWIAGYEKDVDWIESTALDFFFFNALVTYNKGKTQDETQIIQKTARKLKKDVGGLSKRLGFKIYLSNDDGEFIELDTGC